MERNITAQLNSFYRTGTKLLISGIRGAGKSYSVLKFASEYSQNCLYINFETDAKASAFFDETDCSSLSEAVSAYYGIEPDVILGIFFIFDEIWASKGFIRLFNALDGSESIVFAAITSRRLKEANKRISVLNMYPMEFDEYLRAVGREWYIEVIEGHFAKEKALPQIIHNELLDLYEEYLRIGGMPAAVIESINDETGSNIESVQMNTSKAIYRSCRSLFEAEESPLIEQRADEILYSMPKQIYEGRKRFTFSCIRKGLTYNDFEPAIDNLRDRFALIVQNRMGEDKEGFRLYPADQGLMNYMIRSSLKYDESCISDVLLYSSILKSLTQKYGNVEYWESSNSAHMDFVVHRRDGELLPIFINTSGTSRSKSPAIFMEQLPAKEVIMVGNTAFKRVGTILQVPVYAVFLL